MAVSYQYPAHLSTNRLTRRSIAIPNLSERGRAIRKEKLPVGCYSNSTNIVVIRMGLTYGVCPSGSEADNDPLVAH